MSFLLILTIIIAGNPVELIDSRRFTSLSACNVELAKFADLKAINHWAVTCIADVRA